MKNLLLLIISLVCVQMMSAQTNWSDLSEVPDSVKKNADVIKREEDILFEVTDLDKARLTVHKVLTVTNIKGKDALIFNQYSNSFIKLADADIKVFNAAGKQINRVKLSDMHTVAMPDGLVDEGEITYFSVREESYPVTVEINYEFKFKGTLFYPDYEISSAGEGVVRSNFTARVPLNLDLRYKEKNISLPPVITEDKKYKSYRWSVHNIAAFELEENISSRQSQYPSIILAPVHFNIYNTEGDMSSWKNFGLWEYSLLKDLDKLTDERKYFFKTLVKNAATDREKVKLVYEYLQKNFRYVSIQLGIGGYKPFSALFTDQYKYGDCKGLSYYMYAVLKELGIKSNIALINAGYNAEPVDPLFPCNQFNHVILCVQDQKDSIWLECTSNTNDFGTLGSFTENRNALLITGDGGHLVATPRSRPANNTYTAKTVIDLQEDGSGNANSVVKTNGEYKQAFIHSLEKAKTDDQKDFLINELGLKLPDEFSVSRQDLGNQYSTVVTTKFEHLPEFTAGSKVFLCKRIFKIWNRLLPKETNRKFDFYFNFPLRKTDTTIYQLPKGFISESLPEGKKIDCGYAHYSTSYWYNKEENAVYSTATLQLDVHKIPSAAYGQVKIFFDKVAGDEAEKLMVKKL